METPTEDTIAPQTSEPLPLSQPQPGEARPNPNQGPTEEAPPAPPAAVAGQDPQPAARPAVEYGPVDSTEFVADQHFGLAAPRVSGGGNEPAYKRARGGGAGGNGGGGGGGGGRKGPGAKSVYISITRKDANKPWVGLNIIMRDVALRVVEIDHGDGPRPSAPLDLWNDRTDPATRLARERFARELVRSAAIARAHVLTDAGVARAVAEAELPRSSDDRTKNMYIARYCYPQQPPLPGQTKPPKREVVPPLEVAAMTPEQLVPFGSPTLFFGVVPLTDSLLQQYREAIAEDKQPPRVTFFRTPADELLPPHAVIGREIAVERLGFSIDCVVVSKMYGSSIKLHLHEAIGVPVARRLRDVSLLTPGRHLANLAFSKKFDDAQDENDPGHEE